MPTCPDCRVIHDGLKRLAEHNNIPVPGLKVERSRDQNIRIVLPQWGIHYENGRRTSFCIPEEELVRRAYRLAPLVVMVAEAAGRDVVHYGNTAAPNATTHYSNRLDRTVIDSFYWILI